LLGTEKRRAGHDPVVEWEALLSIYEEQREAGLKAWANGSDLAPEFLLEMMRGKRQEAA